MLPLPTSYISRISSSFHILIFIFLLFWRIPLILPKLYYANIHMTGHLLPRWTMTKRLPEEACAIIAADMHLLLVHLDLTYT